MTDPAAPGAGKRRGPRQDGTDTRQALIDAAREVFVKHGYEQTNVRVVAARAGVNAAMVNYWFGGKAGLFGEAVLKLPFYPKGIADSLLATDPDDIGEVIARTFLTIWDRNGDAFIALMRSAYRNAEAVAVLRDVVLKPVLYVVIGRFGPGDRELRATLVATQLVGMGMVRYALRFEPLVSADIDTIAVAIGPTIQRYITGTVVR